jgi:hypothetical protein
MHPDQIVVFCFIFFVHVRQHLVQIVSLMIEIIFNSQILELHVGFFKLSSSKQ